MNKTKSPKKEKEKGNRGNPEATLLPIVVLANIEFERPASIATDQRPRIISQIELLLGSFTVATGDTIVVFHISTPSMKRRYSRLLWSLSALVSLIVTAPNLLFPL